MRVLIAPDKFAGTLSADEAAQAIARGWQVAAPDDVVELCPMSDGGPGFVDVVARSVPGERVTTTVQGPHGEPVKAQWWRTGRTAYLESAQACGRELTDPLRALSASSYGVGELVAQALDAGADRVVVGLGGSGTTDGGAGLLAALGATSATGSLTAGAAGLAGVSGVALGPVLERVAGREIVMANDVDNPLTGLFGAAKTYGPQKGLDDEQVLAADGWLSEWAHATELRRSLDKGAGAAGGLGFALLLLGAAQQPGIELVGDVVQLAAKARAADLVITGEGSFDFSSRSGKVPYGVAQVAMDSVRPCVALAGRVLIGGREMRALGVDSAYSMSEVFGEAAALAEPAETLAALAQRVARTWSR